MHDIYYCKHLLILRQHKVSDYLSVSPGKKAGKKSIFMVDQVSVMEAGILEDVNLKAGNLLYAARSKLDNIGAIKSHSYIANDSGKTDRMVQKLELYKSVGEIQLAEKRRRR